MLLYFKRSAMLAISLTKSKKIGAFLHLVYFSTSCPLLLPEHCGSLREDYCFHCREATEAWLCTNIISEFLNGSSLSNTLQLAAQTFDAQLIVV